MNDGVVSEDDFCKDDGRYRDDAIGIRDCDQRVDMVAVAVAMEWKRWWFIAPLYYQFLL